METDRTAPFVILAAASLLLWPAVWNGYPVVFADTGTYLSQAIAHYAGWDRPVFYSLFMLPLHATVTVWPVVIAQALLTVWTLWLVCRTLLPSVAPIPFIGGIFALTVCTWLPWIVSELMPDLFTPLLVLVIFLLVWTPESLSRREQIVLVGEAAWMIASQQSSLPLAFALTGMLGLLARFAGTVTLARPRCRPAMAVSRLRRLLLITLPIGLAGVALCTVNLLAHGRLSLAPFGNVFLLARVIYDGPGMAILRRDCPTHPWRLCPFLDRFPPTSDDFLWSSDSPLTLAGGAKAVSQDAGAIIEATIFAYPAAEARAVLANALEQLTRFASGDGLNPWPAQVSPQIERYFPARETIRYASARQQTGALVVPPPLPAVHCLVGLGGVVACLGLLPLALIRRAPSAGLLLAVVIVLPVSAAITGGLSAPHERYQSRIMWLPPFIAAISVLSLRRPVIGSSA